MPTVVIVVLAVVISLAAGIGIGLVLARRRPVRPPEPAPQPQPSRFPISLASLVLEVLGHGVAVVNRDEQVVLINPAAREMGIAVRDRLRFAELSRVVRDCVAGRAPVEAAVDLPMHRVGREPAALAVRAVPLPDGNGQVRAVALQLDDVTDARRLEDVRRDFVANVSHELKTPVGALTLLAEAVQDAKDDPEAVQRFASRMQREGSRLGRLVRELIELSRLQGAEPLPGTNEVWVRKILDEAADRNRLAADQAGISVAVHCAQDLVVRGSETQLSNAVSNLIDNAIAYSSSGTRVAVTARDSVDPHGRPCVEIAVSDQGMGIGERDLNRVFERFYRVDPARSRETGGTGLGLAIVKHVASNHGGTVDVWSAEGAGSTFTIRLPIVNPDRPPSSSDESGEGSPSIEEQVKEHA